VGVSRRKRVRRSASEWARIFERFEASRLSKTAFCRHEGIGEGSFGRWRARLSTPQRSDFVLALLDNPCAKQQMVKCHAARSSNLDGRRVHCARSLVEVPKCPALRMVCAA